MSRSFIKKSIKEFFFSDEGIAIQQEVIRLERKKLPYLSKADRINNLRDIEDIERNLTKRKNRRVK